MEKNKRGKRVTSVISENSTVSGRELNMTWQQAMNDFLMWKKSQGIGETTSKDYVKHISAFYKRYPEIWNDTYQTKKSIVTHMSDDIMPATYNLRLIYLRVFFNWCIDEGMMESNPLFNYKKKKLNHVSLTFR